MRRLILLVSGLMVFAGCQERSEKTAGQGKSVLPPEVAGIWQSNTSPWVIRISPEGKLVSAMIPMGEVEIGPNDTTEAEMLDGSISTYEAGDCPVEYNPKTRELFVTIEMKAIHVKFGSERIDGNSIDRFIGPVSEDGKTWNADWVTVFDYGPRFPQDVNNPNDVYPEPLIFEKVVEEPNTPADSNKAPLDQNTPVAGEQTKTQR